MTVSMICKYFTGNDLEGWETKQEKRKEIAVGTMQVGADGHQGTEKG